MRALRNPLGYIALGLGCSFAVVEEWSQREFCWSTWLTSLTYSWACAASASIRIIHGVRREKAALEARLGILNDMSFAAFLPAITLVALIAWALFGENFQQPTIVVLMCLFYLMPKSRGRSMPFGARNPD